MRNLSSFKFFVYEEKVCCIITYHILVSHLVFYEGMKMMAAAEIILGTEMYAYEIKDRLYNELKLLDEKGLDIETEEILNHQWVFFILKTKIGSKQGESRLACRFVVAKAVSDLYIDYVEVSYIRRFINNNYFCWSSCVRGEVTNRIFETLDKLQNVRRNRILQSIYDYLGDHNVLFIEGFERFRLKKHWNYLNRLVQRTGQEFIATREYLEFIKILRNFIEGQEPKINESHIFITPEGAFCICDELGNIIREEYIQTPSLTISNGMFNYKDFLLSILITLVPQIIIFHVPDQLWYADPLKTVKLIFGKRVVRCSGCNKCQHLIH